MNIYYFLYIVYPWNRISINNQNKKYVSSFYVQKTILKRSN